MSGALTGIICAVVLLIAVVVDVDNRNDLNNRAYVGAVCASTHGLPCANAQTKTNTEYLCADSAGHYCWVETK